MIMSDRNEDRLLLESCRLFLKTSNEEKVLEYLRKNPDFHYLKKRCREEGVTGIVASQLIKVIHMHHLDLPLELFRKQLLNDYGCNARFLTFMSLLGGKLERHGIEAILLKGACLLKTIYSGNIACRPISDIDLLVRRADLSRVQQLLTEMGFRGDGASFTCLEYEIDLHADLLGLQYISGRTLAYRFEEESLWKHSTAAGSFRVLSRTDQFMHLSVHVQKHSYSRLIWLMDIALLYHTTDLNALISRAKKNGTERSVKYALELITQVLGVDTIISNKSASLNIIEKAYLKTIMIRPQKFKFGECMAIFAISGMKNKARYFFELCFPKRETLRRNQPNLPGYLIYPHRFIQLLGNRMLQAIKLGHAVIKM